MKDEQRAELLAEAHKLRFSVRPWSGSDGLEVLHQSLLQTRASLDRLEQIVALFIAAEAADRQQVADAQAESEDAWNAVATDPTMAFRTGFSEPAPRERYATYSTRTVGEQVRLRKAQREHGYSATALELGKLFHRGLDSVRRDLDTRIRLITMTTVLER